MSSFASAVKVEIQRVARKEIREHLTLVRKATIKHRHEIASLKRSIRALEQKNRSLRRAEPARPEYPDNGATASPTTARRFDASGLRSLRERLDLSAPEFGRLIGVSSQSIYNWEQEKARPRAAQLEAISRARALGKRKARVMLDELS